jgi:hypothetical protein
LPAFSHLFTHQYFIVSTIILLFVSVQEVHKQIISRHITRGSLGLDNPSWLRPSHCWDFEITLRHNALGRSTLDQWSASRRDSTWQHTTLTGDRHLCHRWDSKPQTSKWAARNPRFRTLCHRYRQGPHYHKICSVYKKKFCSNILGISISA